MDDQYAISVAMTEFREGWNSGDPARVLSIFANELTNWSEDTASFYGAEGRRSMELRVAELLANFRVELGVQMINVAVSGASATERGWLNFKLTPKAGGGTVATKLRYLHSWIRQGDNWKVKFVMTNRELPPQLLPES